MLAQASMKMSWLCVHPQSTTTPNETCEAYLPEFGQEFGGKHVAQKAE
jgi:hypothetical protein